MPLVSELRARWERQWKVRWERKHGPATITPAEATWLFIGYTEGIPDVSEWANGVPQTARALLAAWSRDADELLDFLGWVAKTCERVHGSKLFHARLRVQAVNARTKGWQAKDVAASLESIPPPGFKKGENFARTVEDAVAAEHVRISGKRGAR